MTQPLMTITRFATLAWNWMDQGAPDADERCSWPGPLSIATDRSDEPDLDDADQMRRQQQAEDEAECQDAPALTDLDVAADLSWIDNFNWVGSRYHY